MYSSLFTTFSVFVIWESVLDLEFLYLFYPWHALDRNI